MNGAGASETSLIPCDLSDQKELHLSALQCLLPLALTAGVTAAFATAGVASAPPVGQLPPGPLSTIHTKTGELLAVALPRRSGGRVWRVARAFNGRIVHEVTEGDLGSQVVLVFKATGRGTTTISFGLTRGERPKAYESRRFIVTVG